MIKLFSKYFFASVITVLISGCGIRYFEEEPDNSVSTLSSLFFDFSPQVVSMTRTSPAISVSASADGTPLLSGELDRVGSITFYSDVSCTVSYGTVMTNQSKAFSFSGIQFTVDGSYTIYYRTYDTVRRIWGSCENTRLGYRFQAVPIIQFSRTAYSITDAKNYIGSSIRVFRDVGGVTGQANLDFSELTARDAVHVTPGGLTINFTASDSDLYQDIPTANVPAINTAATLDIDRYFIVRIKTVDVNSKIGSDAMAQVNYIDTNTSGEYFFSHSFYSVTDSASTASIVVQRKTTGSAASVSITFTDGTAIGGSDYTSTAITSSFAASDSETTITVPISNVSSNRSFYAKIASSNVRPQSIAKVRILDSAESTDCQSLAGDGSTGDPFTICKAGDLGALGSSNKVYKLMADLDIPTQKPIKDFTGTFDGNERVLTRFTDTDGNPNQGLFEVLGATTSETSQVSNLNLLYFFMVGPLNSVGGLAGSNGDAATLYPAILKNIHTSGYLETVDKYAGSLVGKQDCTLSVNSLINENILSSGLIYNNKPLDRQGGQSGEIDCSDKDLVTLTLSNLMNTTSVVNTALDYAGGIAATLLIGENSATNLNVSNLENRGTIRTQSRAGGIFGRLNTAGGTQTLSGLKNYGAVGDANNRQPYISGDIGVLEVIGNLTIDDSHNYASVIGNDYIGGISAYLTFNGANSSLTLSNSSNEGKIDASTSYGGGILGRVISSNDDNTLTVSSAINSGAVIGGDYLGGILGGWTPGAAEINNNFSIISSTNSGAITSTSGAQKGTGGIMGAALPTSTGGGNSLTISSSTNSGNVTGTATLGGILGEFSPTSDFGTLSNTYFESSGNLSGSNFHNGGILGIFSLTGAATANLTITNPTVSGTFQDAKHVGGIVGEITAKNSTLQISGANSSANLSSPTVSQTIGGLISYATLTSSSSLAISSSKFTGTISNLTSAQSGAGGFIGYITANDNSANTVSILQSYSTGNIVGNVNTIAIGGLIGGSQFSGAGSSLSISKSYFSGNLTGSSYVAGLLARGSNGGGFVGTAANTYTAGTYTSLAAVNSDSYSFSNGLTTLTNSYSRAVFVYNGSVGLSGIGTIGTVTNSFWLKDATYNTGVTSDGNQRSDAQLQNAATFTGAGWDLGGTAANIWQILTYPFLSGMP